MKDQEEIGVTDQRGVLSNDVSQGPRSWGGRGDGMMQMVDDYGGEEDDETMARGEVLSGHQ
jgi:hypothetical protein